MFSTIKVIQSGSVFIVRGKEFILRSTAESYARQLRRVQSAQVRQALQLQGFGKI